MSVRIPRRTGFASPIEAIMRTPMTRGKKRRYFEYKFPTLTLNAGEINSAVIRSPDDAYFIVRALHFSVNTTANPTSLGRARISSASNKRPNFAWSNRLVPLEIFGQANTRTPHLFYKPNLIEPGSTITLEVENIDASQHLYQVTLVGELVWDLSVEELAIYSSYAWFGYFTTFTNDKSVLPTNTFEMRTQPDADFYITHFTALNFGTTNAAGTGPTRTIIRLGTQGNPIMDQPISNTNLFGSYYNLTIVPVTSIGPTPLPIPLRVSANSNITIQATRDDSQSGGTAEILLEGIKVFK